MCEGNSFYKECPFCYSSGVKTEQKEQIFVDSLGRKRKKYVEQLSSCNWCYGKGYQTTFLGDDLVKFLNRIGVIKE